MPIFSYDQQTLQLEEGDLVAIFSDGVTEAENAPGEQFEAARLTDLLVQHSHLPLDDLIKVVTDNLTRWIHQPETRDDITIVLARKRPASDDGATPLPG
jgi:phosphoserine phosphatase RsbU/P